MKNSEFKKLSPQEAKAIRPYVTATKIGNKVSVSLVCENGSHTIVSEIGVTVYNRIVDNYVTPVGMSDGELSFCCDGYFGCTSEFYNRTYYVPDDEGSGTEGSGTFFDLGDDATAEDIKLL